MNTSRCHTLTGVFDNQNSLFFGGIVTGDWCSHTNGIQQYRWITCCFFFVSPNKTKAKIKNANGGNWVSCGESWFMDEGDGLILVQIGRIRMD